MVRHAHPGAAWSYGLPELYPPTGPLIANPGCYATAALLALHRSRARSTTRRRRREVRRVRRRQDAEAVVARRRRAREPLALRGRRAPACAGNRAAARRSRLLRPAPAARAARPARHVLRADERGPRAPCSRTPTPASPAVRVLPEGTTPELGARPGDRRCRDRRLRPTGHRDGDRHLRARQPRQGRRGPSGAEREPRARARGDSRAAADGGARMSVTAATGLRRIGGSRRDPTRSQGRRAAPADVPCDRRCAMDAEPRASGTGRRVEAAPRARPAAGGRRQLGDGERGDRDTGVPTRSRLPNAAAALGLATEQVLVLSTGVIGAPLPLERCSPGIQLRPRSSRPTAARRGRGDPHDRHPRQRSPSSGAGVHGRRDGERLRDDPSQPRDDARDRHDRLPARAGEASDFLRPAVDAQLQRISVDGECSTNDAVVLLATARAASSGHPRPTRLRARLGRCADLAKQIVADGEGATLSRRSLSRAPRATPRLARSRSGSPRRRS